jgi:hypothetical protein
VASDAPIVHIGYPKAASTWFQKSFYPHVRAPRYIERPRVNAAFLEGNALTFDPAAARRTLGLGEGEPGILCEEGLCGYLHNGGVAGIVSRQVAEQIKAALPDAHIVIFLRAQPRILVAAYQQYVRSGGTHSAHRYFFPGDYLSGPNAVTYKQPRFDVDFFRYSPLVEFYETLFGRDRLHLFLFEQFQADGLDFLRRFAGELELDVDWDGVSLAPRLASYGRPLTWFARISNRFTARSVLDKHHVAHIPGWYKVRRSLLESLNRSGLFGRPPPLDRLVGRETAAWLEGHYAADNQRLAERYTLPLADFGYPMEFAGEPLERPKGNRLYGLFGS